MFALKTLRRETGAPALPALRLVAAAALVATLAACSKPAPKVEDVRPVRAIVLASSNVDVNAEFSGEVVARVTSQLGFRVGGKIVERKVDVGAVVKRGQVLMQLDPQDLQLSQAQAKASLNSAETSRDLARAELKRYQDLREKNFVSQAVLDAKQSALKAAQANVEAARAGLRGQSNQADYTTLVADVDGVVTAIDAEVGQVVQAGTPVVRVARTAEKDVVIGIPENKVDKVDALRQSADVVVRLWADAEQTIPGKIRVIAPMADAATRTYSVKVALPARADARLGMSATVELATGAATSGGLRVPLSALVNNKGASSVWVVENGAVRLVPVQVAGQVENDVLVSGAVRAGQNVVTAGVNLLKPGQKVRILTADVARRADAEAAMTANGGAAR